MLAGSGKMLAGSGKMLVGSGKMLVGSGKTPHASGQRARTAPERLEGGWEVLAARGGALVTEPPPLHARIEPRGGAPEAGVGGPNVATRPIKSPHPMDRAALSVIMSFVF